MKIKLKEAIQLRSKNKYVEAETIFQELIANHPLNPEVHYHYAWLCDNMERESEAVPLYQKAIELNLNLEELPDCYLGLGSTLRALGRYEDAKAIFSKGINLFPSRKDLGIFNAMNNYNLGFYQESIKTLLELLIMESSDINIQKYKKAILQYSNGLDKKYN